MGLTSIISSPLSTLRIQSSWSSSVKPNCLMMLLGTVVLRDSFFVVARFRFVISPINFTSSMVTVMAKKYKRLPLKLPQTL